MRPVSDPTELSVTLHFGDTVRLGELRLFLDLLDYCEVDATWNILVSDDRKSVALGVRSRLRELERQPTSESTFPKT